MEQEIENYKNPDWLYTQYWARRLPASEIAEKCSVGEQTIYNWMDRFNLTRRTLSEAFRGRKCHDKWKENVRITKNKQFPVERYRYKDKAWLYDQYITKKKRIMQIAKENDFGKSVVSLWLAKFGIQIRKVMSGSDHPLWKGGSPGYYRRQARKIWEEWHGRKLPKGWEIHHIDYNIKNNAIWNLLAVTKEEHAKIHNKGQRLVEWLRKNKWQKHKTKNFKETYQHA